MSDKPAGLWQDMSLIVVGRPALRYAAAVWTASPSGRRPFMQCPFCGSAHLQRYPVVRAQGTVRVESEHVGVNGPFVARSQGIGYTDAARQCARPPLHRLQCRS
jgi:hypothetical protein